MLQLVLYNKSILGSTHQLPIKNSRSLCRFYILSIFFFNKLNLNQISIRSIVIHTFVCTYCIMRKLKQPVSISHMFSNSSIHVCFGHYTHTWNCGFENLIVLIRSHKEILANVQIKNCRIYLYMVYKQFAAYYKLKLH